MDKRWKEGAREKKRRIHGIISIRAFYARGWDGGCEGPGISSCRENMAYGYLHEVIIVTNLVIVIRRISSMALTGTRTTECNRSLHLGL